jgi:paraquat-inducible protein A
MGKIGRRRMTRPAASAASRGLLTCHTCGLLSRSAPLAHDMHCPRCDAPLHLRKPNSISRSWALLIAAMICYIPANMMPMMLTTTLFGTESDTIMSGVIYFWTSGSWYLALVIFTASIMVPMLKMIALTLLLVTTQMRSRWQTEQRARLYRLVEIIGRWSMLDIYVVAIMVALVQLQGLATILPGPGAIAFGSVVVLTMFSAMAFDPRLMWDPVEENEEKMTDGEMA